MKHSILGYSGFATEVFRWAHLTGREPKFYFDSKIKREGTCLITNLRISSEFDPEFHYFLGLDNPRAKFLLLEFFQTMGVEIKLASLQVPSHYGLRSSYLYNQVSASNVAADGLIACPGAMITMGVSIGYAVTLNMNSTIENNTIIGDYCTLDSGARVLENCKLGQLVRVGPNAVINPGIHVCDSVEIRAGSVVTKDIKNPGVYSGNPAKLEL